MTKNTTIRITFVLFALIATISLIARGNAGSGTEYGTAQNIRCSVPKEAVFDTSYGSLDCSSAGMGYVTFTASGGGYTFLLQGPEGTQTIMDVQKGIPAAFPLSGSGMYHFAVSSKTPDGSQYLILYKNSFSAAVDSPLNV